LFEISGKQSGASRKLRAIIPEHTHHDLHQAQNRTACDIIFATMRAKAPDGATLPSTKRISLSEFHHQIDAFFNEILKGNA
jgi:hypothetical protein